MVILGVILRSHMVDIINIYRHQYRLLPDELNALKTLDYMVFLT